jgi:phage gp46-like protein
MSDIALVWSDTDGGADLVFTANDLERDDSLETAVLLSLFTGDANGWWGDEFPVVPNDTIGSALYELNRAKALPTTARRAEEIAGAALAWLVTDAVAERVDVVVTATAPVLNFLITIVRPAATPAVYQFAYNWQAQELKHAV